MPTHRKLAAIFYADVAGYSRLTGLDEEGTHHLVMKMLDSVAGQIKVSDGEVLRYAGDAILATFDSVVRAVQTAIEIQRRLHTENSTVDTDRRIAIRIGINLGDVIDDRGEVYGSGVNIAARLEAAAEPGGICISSNAHEQIEGHQAEKFTDGGEQSFKNINRPIKVWHWVPSGKHSLSTVPESQTTPVVLDKLAIAVLPFNNMSDDPEQEYFSDGLTEDIITALSQWRSMPVIARNSTFTYKGRAVQTQTVAEELGVKYVLEGSIRKAGKRVRVNAQLIDAESGHHVWAKKFDSQLEDIFDIQDEITDRIAAIIIPEVQSFEKKRSIKKRTEDFTAWDFYLRGIESFYLDTCEGVSAARDMFQSAVDKDAHYGDAWARLGWCYAKLVMQSCVEDTASTLDQGFAAAQRAVLIDDDSALAHLALGTVHIFSNETEKGTEEAIRAVELNPNNVEALFAAGNRLDLMGRADEGVDMICRALKLNPRDPARWRYMAYLSRACIARSDPDGGLDWARKAVLLKPELAEAQFRYAVALANVDQVDETRLALAKCDAAVPGYVASKTDWKPYPDDVRNELVMDGLRRYSLLG